VVEMDEEIWVINKTKRKLKVELKEAFLYYGNIVLPNETITEDIGGRGYERRIVIEIHEEEREEKGDE